MLEDVEMIGTWYIAGHSRTKLNGKLTYSIEEGLILTVDGAFGSVWNLLVETSHIQFPEWIIGRTSAGKTVSLYRCLATGIAQEQSVYSVEVALLGYKHRKSKKLLFQEVLVKYHNLHQWASLGGYTRKVERNPTRFNFGYL